MLDTLVIHSYAVLINRTGKQLLCCSAGNVGVSGRAPRNLENLAISLN